MDVIVTHHMADFDAVACALAWTMERGANQAVIDRYLNPPLSTGQRAALAGVLSQVQPESLDGVPVGIAVVPLRAHVDGLSGVTWHAAHFEKYAAVVVLYVVKGSRVQIIGRARSPVVDLGRALATFGGGGHRAAASAGLKDVDPLRVRQQVVEALRVNLIRPQRVSDLMSRPVETVPAETPLGELRVQLVRRAISGMPVVRDGHLVGVISRTDVDRAARDGRLHLPVSSCMSHDVLTAQPAMLLETVLDEMTRAGVGRLPVLHRGALVGIITRTDIREALYPLPRGAEA